MELDAAVLSLAVHPEKDAPGRALDRAAVDGSGLVGDRPKKRPVHVVGRGHTGVRANIVLDVADEELQELVGRDTRLGGVVLRLTQRPSNCPGVYADVVATGEVAVGDRARLAGSDTGKP